MALGTFIAGRYTGTYNAVDVGLTEQGYRLRFQPRKQAINRTDAYGDTLLDNVYRGGNFSIQFVCQEYKAGSYTPAWPYGALGVMGVIGRLDSDLAMAFVLTATASTPAALAPATLTASKAVLAEDSNVELLFNSELRQVPITLTVLPVDSGSGVIKWYTST
jgi:hypothetical protein